MTDVRDPLAVAIRIGQIFDALGVRHTIGGSIAASFAGEPRSTIDIDFVVALDHGAVAAVIAELGDEFYADAGALHRAIDTLGTANLIHQATQIKVDLFIAGGTPLDEQQLQRRLRIEVRPGMAIYIHPPEDILLQKLRWFVRGGSVSDRQWRDVLSIIRAQAGRLDRQYLVVNSEILEVRDALERALSEGGTAKA